MPIFSQALKEFKDVENVDQCELIKTMANVSHCFIVLNFLTCLKKFDHIAELFAVY